MSELIATDGREPIDESFIHILRNPYGFSDDDIREARNVACDAYIRERDRADKNYDIANKFMASMERLARRAK